jgi:hypothetical protein
MHPVDLYRDHLSVYAASNKGAGVFSNADALRSVAGKFPRPWLPGL